MAVAAVVETWAVETSEEGEIAPVVVLDLA